MSNVSSIEDVYVNESDLVSTALVDPQSTPADSPFDPVTYKWFVA